MIEFRAGNYTIYDGYILSIIEDRYELPIKKEEKTYTICYLSIHNYNLEKFKKHCNEDKFCKNISRNEIKNAFYSQTFGLYENVRVKVFEYKNNRERLYTIATSDSLDGEKLNMIEVNVSWYVKTIKLSDLTKLWEERSSSQYDLPMPDGLKE
ncbi:MAG: hypothetical protein ACK504_02905 [Bacteroidota bacterium]